MEGSSATTDIKLDNLFYDFESIRDESQPFGLNVSELIASYKEYQTEKTPARVTPVPKGFFFPYQEQQARFSLHVDKILGSADPGTGKTFTAMLQSEMLRGNYDPSLPRDPLIERLPPGIRQYLTPTRTNIRRTVYLTVNHVLDRQALEAVPIVKNAPGLTRADEEWYTSRSYGTYLTEYAKQYKAELARLPTEGREEAYAELLKNLSENMRLTESNTFFVLDEVHRLTGENMKNIANDDNINYLLIRLLLKSIERSPVVLFTATPINNATSEIIPILNLILPYDEEIPLSTDLDSLSDKQLDTLIEDKCKDRTFYISSNPSGINPIYMGTPLPGSPFAYVDCEMEGKQLEQYIQAVNGTLKVVKVKATGAEIDEEEQKKDSLHSTETMAALCWAPLEKEVVAGRAGVKSTSKPASIIRRPDDPIIVAKALEQEQTVRSKMPHSRRVTGHWAAGYEGTVREMVDNPQYLFDIERMRDVYGEKVENWKVNGPRGNNLRQRSSKYYKILKEMLHPVTGSIVAVVFFRFLVRSGLESFTAIALLNGYERYEDTLSDVASGKHIINLTKKKRLIVLTPSMKSPTIRLWLDIVKHPDNVNGEYINLVLISPGMKIGISIFSARRFYHTSPDWSPSGELQSLYRVLREGGADAILKHLGIWPNGTVDCELNLLCSTMPKKLPIPIQSKTRHFTELFRSKTLVPTTIDEDMYNLLAYKYSKHIRVLSRIRRISVSCSLNTERNVEVTTCTSVSPTPSVLVENPYNVLYTRRHVWALKQYICSTLLAAKQPIHLSDILSNTRDYQIPLICYYRAISELVREKEPLVNELGMPVYVGYSGERVYIQRDFPVSSSSIQTKKAEANGWLMDYYAQSSVLTYSVNEQVATFDLTDDAIAELQSITNLMKMREYIRLHYPQVESQMVVLETAMMQTFVDSAYTVSNWKKSPWAGVLEVYRLYWEVFKYPIGDSYITMAHSLASFWREAGYPIIARIRQPSRYRYYSSDGWRTTHERSSLVDNLYQVYSKASSDAFFDSITKFPAAIETICDGVFRVLVSQRSIRGRMVSAMAYVDLAYLYGRLLPVPTKPHLEEEYEDIYSEEDMSPELSQQLTDEERAEALRIANILSHTLTRKSLASLIRRTLIEKKRISYA